MWEQIRYNQTRSAMLIFGMGILLALLGHFFGILIGNLPILNIDLFISGIYGVLIALMIWVVASMIAYLKGDDILLALTGAQKISTVDLERLKNIVEELKIASGLEKMPDIYIIEDPAMNAFATGRDPNKAAVVVTSGLLTKLNRDELQGVIGHEIAHIKNRDVLLMSLCFVLLGIITNLTWTFVHVMYSVRNSSSVPSGWWFPLILLLIPTIATPFVIRSGLFGEFAAALAVLYFFAFLLLSPMIAQLVYHAISKRREYLADACSALYTRYPEGLALALEKIAASPDQVLAVSPATAPIYIVNPFHEPGKVASDITSTHPPISERIRILRAMAQASYAEYDRAYREIRGVHKGLIPAYATATAGTAAIREAIPDDLDHIQRARETSNALWNARNYSIITCACGTRMRLPPSFKLTEVRCPHCGRINPV